MRLSLVFEGVFHSFHPAISELTVPLQQAAEWKGMRPTCTGCSGPQQRRGPEGLFRWIVQVVHQLQRPGPVALRGLRPKARGTEPRLSISVHCGRIPARVTRVAINGFRFRPCQRLSRGYSLAGGSFHSLAVALLAAAPATGERPFQTEGESEHPSAGLLRIFMTGWCHGVGSLAA